MVALGLASKRPSSHPGDQGERASDGSSVDSEEAKKVAAAALSAVRDVTSAANSAVKGRVEVSAWFCSLSLSR